MTLAERIEALADEYLQFENMLRMINSAITSDDTRKNVVIRNMEPMISAALQVEETPEMVADAMVVAAARISEKPPTQPVVEFPKRKQIFVRVGAGSGQHIVECSEAPPGFNQTYHTPRDEAFAQAFALSCLIGDPVDVVVSLEIRSAWLLWKRKEGLT